MFKALFSNLNMYIYVALIALVSALFIHNQFLKKDVESLNFQINNYEQKIQQLKLDSKRFEDRVNLAEESTAMRIEEDIFEANKILSLNVSSDCDQAVHWAKEQAAKI